VPNWIQFVDIYAHGAERVIVGNKNDLSQLKQVDNIQAESWANERGITLFQTSAKTGDNVELAFTEVATAVYRKITSSGFLGRDASGKKGGIDFKAPAATRKSECSC
jgi:Ras-related protein Rab-1A